MTQKYKTIRVVVEVRAPPEYTEKDLVFKIRDIIKWPIQLGKHGDSHTLVRPLFKQYTKVSANDFMRRRGIVRSLFQKGE